MPGNLLTVDTSFPQLAGKTDEQKFRTITDYLYMLLEQLRYTLRNLGMENFNDAELGSFVDYLKANIIEADTTISHTVIVNELYADYGSVADLTVDKLRTDYKRAQRYLQGDTSPLDYISIHDEEISFITAATDGTQTEQMEVDGLKFWWTDASKTQMTSREQTAWPVMVYVYTEQVKGSFRFQPVTLDDGSVTAMPVLTFGVGDQNGRRKGTIVKGPNSMEIIYTDALGKQVGVKMSDDGHTDIIGLRKPTALDFSGWDSGSFSETVDGDVTETYQVTFDSAGNPITITDSVGHKTTITW